MAACVAFSSCGKGEDNDKFKSADEFAVALKKAAEDKGVTINDGQLKSYAEANWKIVSKKNLKFDEVKDKITKQSNPSQSQSQPSQSNTQQTNSNQPQQSQSQPVTTNTSDAQSISDESKLSVLVKIENGKHAGVKIEEQYFDLTVFYDLYSWIYDKAGDKLNELVEPDQLTWENVKTIIKKSMFVNVTDDNEKKFGIKKEVSKDWAKENEIYTYDFTASSKPEDAKSLECPCYNGLLKFWAHANDLGFSGEAFQNGTLKKNWSNCGGSNDDEYKKKINSVTTKLAEFFEKK